MFTITIKKDKLQNVFVLEDDKHRIAYFREVFSFVANLVVTKQPGDAVEILSKTKFDLIFLDHDLFEEANSFGMGEEPEELTGLFVAKRLRETINKLTDCIIHSMNPAGAGNMIKAHPFNTAHVPYSMLEESIVLV